MDLRVSRILEAGRDAYPGIDVPDEVFAAAVERVGCDAAEAYAGDLFLACACALGRARAIERLESLCVSQIPKAISRIDRTPNFAAEIQQRVREKLVIGRGTPRIAEYAARGSLAAFVRITAIREALMEKRTTARQRLDYDEPEGIANGDVALEMVRKNYRPEFQAALRAALATLDRRERSALRMSYIDNLSIDEIGQLFQVHRATAARWISRAQLRVREKTRMAMRSRLALTDSEADSLLQDLMSADALSSGMLQSSAAA